MSEPEVEAEGTEKAAEEKKTGAGSAEIPTGSGPGQAAMAYSPPPSEPEYVTDPMVEEFAKRRGIPTKAAARLLAPMLEQFEPNTIEAQRVRANLENIGSLLGMVPDNEVTTPAKGIVWNGAMMQAARSFRRGFTAEKDDTFDFKELEKFAFRMKMMDRVLGPGLGNGGEGEMPVWAKGLNDRVEKLTAEKEEDRLVNRLKDTVKTELAPINSKVSALESKMGAPTTTEKSETTKSIDKLVESQNKLVERMEKEKDDKLVATMEKVNATLEKKFTSGEMNPDQVTKVLDNLERYKKLIGGGAEGATDWKTALAAEAPGMLHDALNILAGGDEEEGLEKLDDGEVDKKVFRYMTQLRSQGKGKMNYYDAAEELHLTSKQVYDSAQRLVAGGYFKVKREIHGRPPEGAEPITEVPEGVSVSAEVEEAVERSRKGSQVLEGRQLARAGRSGKKRK